MAGDGMTTLYVRGASHKRFQESPDRREFLASGVAKTVTCV
jgi:hypothetical protein